MTFISKEGTHRRGRVKGGVFSADLASDSAVNRAPACGSSSGKPIYLKISWLSETKRQADELT
jgi:hypothetical protein